MKILYFTNQDIGSGLFDNQVYSNLLGLKKLNKKYKITLLVFNRPWKFFEHKGRFASNFDLHSKEFQDNRWRLEARLKIPE